LTLKVLIVSAAFYPANSPRSFRSTELAKELARMGHSVDVVTHAHKDQEAIFTKFGINILDIGGSPEAKPFRAISKKISYLLNRSIEIFLDYPSIRYAFHTYKTLRKAGNDYDLMITIAYPHAIHWGTAWFLKWSRPVAKTWVADCGDPFMGASMGQSFRPFYFGYFERLFCQGCDHISVPIDSAKAAYYPEYRHKIVVIPQGFKFEETLALLQPYEPHLVPTFAFAGNISPRIRDPRPLLDYLLKKGTPFQFRAHTNTPHLFDQYAEQLGKSILVYPFVPRTALIPILGSMDFLLNLENGVSTQLPSKLIDYGLTGRPILSFDSSNPDWSIVDEFIGRDYSRAWKAEDMDQYRIEQVANRFLELCP
jgi:hypothetical protein